MLRRTGAAAPPFGLPQNRPMPFRVPGTHAGRRAQTEVASDSGKVPTQRGSPTARGPAVKAKRHRQDVRRQNIDKTAAGKHQQDKPPTAGESPAAQRMRRRDEGIGSEGATGGPSPASRRSAAHEPPAAREPPQQASLLEHGGHQRTPSIGQARGKPGGLLKTHRARQKHSEFSGLSQRLQKGWPSSRLAQFRAGPVQSWPNSGMAQALKTRRARLRKPSRLLEELAEFRTG